MHHPTDRIAHTTAFSTPVVEHWLEREITQWVHHEVSIRRPIARATTDLHLAPSQSEIEGNAIFNDTLKTFYFLLYGIRYMLQNHSVKEETSCHHKSYSFQLAVMVLLYALTHRQDITYHNLYYTSCGALAGMIAQWVTEKA